MANARPMNLILTSSEPKVITGLQNSSDGVNIYVSEASLFLSVSIQSVGWVGSHNDDIITRLSSNFNS